MLRRMIRIAAIGVMAMVVTLLVVGKNNISSSMIYRRELRFFDPDHRTCGRDEADPEKIAHSFATRFLYGATEDEVKDGYYLRRTVSTVQPIPIDNNDAVNHILKVLIYASKFTDDRPIRVNKPVIMGYNSEPVQGYSLVNAINLKKVAAVNAVEDLYWARAEQAQKTTRNVHEVHLPMGKTDAALAIIRSLGDDKDKLEYGFHIDQLLSLDVDVIGAELGVKSGYVNGDWKAKFNCFYEHDNPDAIRKSNDALAKLW